MPIDAPLLHVHDDGCAQSVMLAQEPPRPTAFVLTGDADEEPNGDGDVVAAGSTQPTPVFDDPHAVTERAPASTPTEPRTTKTATPRKKAMALLLREVASACFPARRPDLQKSSEPGGPIEGVDPTTADHDLLALGFAPRRQHQRRSRRMRHRHLHRDARVLRDARSRVRLQGLVQRHRPRMHERELECPSGQCNGRPGSLRTCEN